MAQIIDGKAISQKIKDEVKKETEKLAEQGKKVTLAVIQVGSDAASSVYVNNKKKACEYVGFQSLSYELSIDTTEEELLSLVYSLNGRADVDGILVQLPLPEHLNEDSIIAAIAPEKDVDGFHAVNTGNLWIGKECFVSCTPAGILELLKRSGVVMEGKECVIVGRSNIVGKPMAALMLQENATVTVCHSKTKNLKEITKRADILIVAVGKAGFIHGDHIKQGATVIDVGIHRMDGKKLCGDVIFEEAEKVAGAITPVPGGVGPMTIAMLMKNCLMAAQRKQSGRNEQ